MGFDVAAFRASFEKLNPAAPPAEVAPRPTAPKRTEAFVKGPIPLDWLTRASGMPGSAPLAVGMALWFESGRQKTKTIKLTTATLGRFGVGRKAKYRALDALEGAGLISVVRESGKNPLITILAE